LNNLSAIFRRRKKLILCRKVKVFFSANHTLIKAEEMKYERSLKIFALVALLIVMAIGLIVLQFEISFGQQKKIGSTPLSPSPSPTTEPTTTPSALPTATSSPYGEDEALVLTLTLQKTTFALGEPVNLTVIVTNISDQTIDFTHTGLDFDFKITNGTSSLVYQWSNFKAFAQFITIEPLPAGRAFSQNFTWQQTCNFNLQVDGTAVSPGTYWVTGLTGPSYGMQTSPLQITITNP
jgi:hypothetical protein